MRLDHTTKGILSKHAPQTLGEVVGQEVAVGQLESFAADPYSTAFVFHGPTGVGKTCAAKALANALGCDREFPDLGGLSEIPSGKQDGKAVDEMLRSLRLRPMYGSGWKVAVINEADGMTPQAESIWLDGLEHLPPKTVIVFTTNRIQSLTHRLVGRCEVVEFDGAADDFMDGMYGLVDRVWKEETGRRLRTMPRNIGRFELASEFHSVRLALQQIAPYVRSGDNPPTEFKVPFVRDSQSELEERRSTSARKAWDTIRRNAGRKAVSHA